MSHYARARKVVPVLSFVVGLVAVGVLAGARTISVPGLLGGGTSVLPVAVLLPMVAVAAAGFGLRSRERPQELATTRRRQFYDAGLVLLIAAVSAIGAAVLAATDNEEAAAGLLRNTLMLCGVLLAACAAASVAVGVASAALLFIVTSSYGPANPGARWVRVLQEPAAARWPWLVAGLTLATGLMLMAVEDRLTGVRRYRTEI